VTGAIDNSSPERELDELESLKTFEQSLMVRLLIDPADGKIVAANAAACRYYGYTAEQFRSMSVTDVNALDVATIATEMERARTLQRNSFRFRHRLAAGEQRDVDVYSGPMILGGRTLLESTIVDVTEAVQTSQALAEAAERLRVLMNTTTDGVFLLDASGRLVEVNQRYAEMSGYSPEELVGTLIGELDAHETTEAVVGRMNNYRQYRQSDYRRFERVHQRKDGVLIDVEISLAHVKANDTFIVFIRDITAQHKAAQELRESLELFQNAIDNAPNGMALVAPDGRWLRVNPALCSLTGYSEEELLGLKLWDVVHPGEASTAEQDFSDLLAGKVAAVRTERRYVRKDGTDVPVMASDSLLVRGGEQQPLYFVVQLQDVSEQKRIEDGLRRSNEELEQFAYVVSHDLREPLRAIRNLVGWIVEDVGGDESLPASVVSNIGLLRQRTDRLDALIEGIMSYSRIGSEIHEAVDLDPSRLVEDIWSLLRPSEAVRLRIDCRVDRMRVAEVPLSLVLRNLMDNAAKHNTAPDPCVDVSISEEARGYRFDVADNGPGIPREHRERIFRIFETLAPEDATGSVGVGLALVRKTVAQVGATIEVLDNPAGTGALFRLRWPKA
jgi:PAS domain S-box-containing protein